MNVFANIRYQIKDQGYREENALGNAKYHTLYGYKGYSGNLAKAVMKGSNSLEKIYMKSAKNMYPMRSVMKSAIIENDFIVFNRSSKSCNNKMYTSKGRRFFKNIKRQRVPNALYEAIWLREMEDEYDYY